MRLKALVENRMPWAFAKICPIVDEYLGRDPMSEVNLIPYLVRKGDTVCDIGANRGAFIYWFLKVGAKINAFEPNPAQARILRLRFPGPLDDGRLRLFEMALSDSSGEAVLHIPVGFSPLATIDGNVVSGLGDKVQEVRVPLARLDDCVGDQDISFIKLDVEGHEAKVLEGAQGILSARKPTLIIEAEERHRPGAVATVRSILEPLGYQGFFREDGVVKPISDFDPAIHQAVAELNAEGTRRSKGSRYVVNFIFAARPDIIARVKAWKA